MLARSVRSFREYGVADAPGCLALFDANCPAFFAPNERADYQKFLASVPSGYRVCVENAKVIGAYGLIRREAGSARLNWMLIDLRHQHAGIGSGMMREALREARAAGLSHIEIAASHRSAPFFARFGAVAERETVDGWGPGMHRIDMRLEMLPFSPENC